MTDVVDLGEDLDAPIAREAVRPDGPIRIAFLGKPNVGKSSLVNRLLGEDRVLVHDVAGTTRDPIDTPFSWDGQDYVLVDTAGLRRRRTVKTQVEAVSAAMTRDQLKRADVAVLVISAEDGASNEDARLASTMEEAGRSMLVILNKADQLTGAELKKTIEKTRETLGFVSHVPIVVTSAVTGRGVTDIPSKASFVFGHWVRRVPTAGLNRLLEELVTKRPPPSGATGRRVRLYFITQPEVAPPTFFVSCNQPQELGAPYQRYIANQIRKTFGYVGTPLRLLVRGHRKGTKTAQKTA